MKSTISQKNIIHCTNYKGLKGILSSKYFRPSFCLEECTYLDFERMSFVNDKADTTLSLAFPVVSFTDLPKDKRAQHYKQFGKYALVMSENWKMKNKMSPLFYADKNFFSAKYGLTNAFDYILENLEKEEEDKKRITKTYISFLMMHIKAFSANNTCYYNEREWRWIPYNFDQLKMSLTKEEYNNETIRDEENQKIWKDPNNLLRFDFQDILQLELPNAKYKKDVIILLAKTFGVDSNLAKKKIKIRTT